MEIRWLSRRQWGRIFGRYRVGAKVLMALGGVQTFVRFCVWILDQKSRVEEAMLTVGQLGEVARVLFGAAISPLFGIVLIFLGVVYLIFVSAEEHPAEVYPVLGVWVANIISWITVGACALLLYGALVAGYVAVQVQEQVLAPRILTKEQQDKLLEGLKAAWQGNDKAVYEIVVTPADREAYEYAQQLIDVFVKVGWIGNISPVLARIPTPPGVLMLIKEEGKIPVLTQSVERLLREVGVKVISIVSDEGGSGRDNYVVFVVGQKSRH